MRTIEIGKRGEDAAADYLKQHGYRILCRNYRTRDGEIDIIAQKHHTIAFIEVKTRTGTRFGMAAEAVNARKQHKILLTAKRYIAEKHPKEEAFSLDVIEVYLGDQIKINHIKDAFQE